jgi:hypothetical protein
MSGRTFALAVSLLVVAWTPMPAMAHGSVTTNVASVIVQSGQVSGRYTYTTSNQHPQVLIAVTLQRRPGGGGSWVTLDTNSSTLIDTNGGSVFTVSFTRNCAYDYKAFGSGNSYGSAQGVHLQASDTAPILQNTC